MTDVVPLVYVLDPDPGVRRDASRVLREAGYRVHTFDLWSEASHRLLRSDEPVVLVCELALPGIAGRDFCRTVLKHDARAEIVLFTSAPDAGALAADEARIRWVDKREGGAALLQGVREAAGIDDAGALAYLIGTAVPRPLPIRDRPLTIGRHPERDVILRSTLASRHHATIVQREEAVEVSDHGSRNGTLLDGERLRDRAALVTGNARLDVAGESLELLFGITWERACSIARARLGSETTIAGGDGEAPREVGGTTRYDQPTDEGEVLP